MNYVRFFFVLVLVVWHGTRAHAANITLNMRVRIDTISADLRRANNTKVGDIDKLRISFDENSVDAKTHRVRLVNFQHFMNGAYTPAAPDPEAMPVADSWLDLSHAPYRLHLRAVVVRGTAIIISVDAKARRLTIKSQAKPHTIILAGSYEIDPTPIREPNQ